MRQTIPTWPLSIAYRSVLENCARFSATMEIVWTASNHINISSLVSSSAVTLYLDTMSDAAFKSKPSVSFAKRLPLIVIFWMNFFAISLLSNRGYIMTGIKSRRDSRRDKGSPFGNKIDGAS